MLAAAHIWESGGAWRPDPRASLGLAFGAAVLLCLAFLGLLYRPATGSRPAVLSLSVIHAPAAHRSVYRPPRLAMPTATALTQLAPLPPIPGFTLLQEQIDQVAQETVTGEQSGTLLALPVRPYDPLSQALQAPEKPGTLKEGQSYRTEYGDTIVKSGDGCASLQQVQVGPVAKAGVGFAVPCPGERRPTMGDQLSQWADKRAEQSPPP